MSKEEIKKIVLSLNSEQKKLFSIYLKSCEEAIKRINKAIEYINTATISQQSSIHYRNCLLSILQGKE